MTGFSKKTLLATALVGVLVAAPMVYAAGSGAMSGGFMGQGQMGQANMSQGQMGQGMGQTQMGQGNMTAMAAMMGSNMGQMPKLTDAQVAYMTKMLANLPKEQRGFAQQMLEQHGITLPQAGNKPATE